MAQQFTDNQLRQFIDGKYTDLIKALASQALAARQGTSSNSSDLAQQVERLKADCNCLREEAYKLAAANDGVLVEPESPTADPNRTCPRHGRRWFARLAEWCICTKCGRYWKEDEYASVTEGNDSLNSP
jgi:hypothetical protein